MPLSSNINTYTDVKKVFDVAVKRGGVRYRLSSHAKAVRWRFRAYYFRTLYYKEVQNTSIVEDKMPETPYDNIVITVEDCDCIVQVIELEGEIHDLEGETVPVEELEQTDDEMLEDIKSFMED